MKRLTKPTLAISLAIILLGCSKNNSGSLPITDQTEIHSYGVLPMQPEQWCVINSSDPVADAKTAIAYNKPVMMSFNVYDNSTYQYFEGLSTRSGKYTYNPLNPDGTLLSGLRLLGGHAVPLIGYIDDASQPGSGVFIVQNSWGTGWGYKGYFYVPYSVLRSKTIVASGSLYVAII